VSAASFEAGPYNFVGRLPNQVVIGQLAFPRGATSDVEASAEMLSETRGARPSPPRCRVLLAKMEIEQHYYTRLSCESLAHSVGMTKFHFIKTFRAAFGTSPYQYLNQVRVRHATHMLALTNQPLRLVAASVGFSTASSLARAFKRFAGASPANLMHKIAPAAAPVRPDSAAAGIVKHRRGPVTRSQHAVPTHASLRRPL
jgi:AraC-like DNA-binding protein